MTRAGFTRKKVATLTLGERLREVRRNFGVSLADASQATQIQAKYLEFLEEGAYDKLPAHVYVRGFVRNYARYLNLDEEAFVKLYDREHNIQENLHPEKNRERAMRPLSGFSLVITPRSIILTCVVLVLSGAFFYLYQEFRSFAAAPRLIIHEPTPNAVIEKSEVVVRGQTEKGARLSINNEAVFVGSEGEFTEHLLLQPGINTITLVAISRLNKERKETFSIEARYAITPPAPPATRFTIMIEAPQSDLELRLEADGNVIFEGILKKGEKKEVESLERLRLSTNRPEATFVSFNNEEAKPLSTDPQAPKEASFIPTGREAGEPKAEEL